ncbi:MAG: restriction endonuclease [Ferrovum sp. 34-44-207]|nr:MAG: restriction endonuclease [Ferrovum sp. 34-44-207]
MTEQASFTLRNRNPDVLTCIANLSNDEVFTPPDLANKMLDMLAHQWAKDNKGENIWENKDIKFLDPCTKSGVFLREITSRLTHGLEKKIPDLDKRVDHILSNQIFGIGITKLTSLLARRSVYCSKSADGEHSIAKSLKSKDGNIWYENLRHTWIGERCKYCGASKSVFDREAGLESHAYALIHSDNAKERLSKIFGGKMQFDVIIGNPPYQLNTEGHGTQARPIYHKFIEQAKTLEPKYLCMVIPARWFSGGMGLDEFRSNMLGDSRLRVIEDFPDSNDVFPGTQIKGGVCFFLWNRDNSGKVKVTTHDKGIAGKSVVRPLLERGADVFIRYNEALPILKKVIAKETKQDPLSDNLSIELPEKMRFMNYVSSIGAFGLDSTFRGKPNQSTGDIKVYRNGGVGYLAKSELTKEKHMVDKWKVFIPRAGSGSDSFPHSILGKPFVGEPGSISSWTYMYIGPFSSKKETENVISYISTKLFRLLVLLHKPSQDATKNVYTFVPIQDFSEKWSDEKLYKKYGITQSEIEFINSMIRPMGDSDD